MKTFWGGDDNGGRRHELEKVTGHGQLQKLKAVRINACPHCQAPGVWKTPQNAVEVEWFKSWPEIVVPQGQLTDKPVGPMCPCCHQPRDEAALTKDLGTIWQRFIPWGSPTSAYEDAANALRKFKDQIFGRKQ